MDKIVDKLFGALGKESCLYFYVLSILAFVLLIVVLLSAIVYIIRHYKRLNYVALTHFLVVSIHLLIAYFVNRLLHTICVKTIS